MKAFNKWYEDYSYHAEDHEFHDPSEVTKDAWRAALEWLNNKAVKLNFSEKGLDICTLQDALQKELEK